MRRAMVLTFTVLVFLAYAPVASGQQQQGCKLNNFTPLPHNTQLAIGPYLYIILNANLQLWSVLGAARDAWNGTHAGGRIGERGFPQSAADCPIGLPIQLGAMDFSLGGCSPVASGGAIAVTDYEVRCAGCGTKSILINTNVPWSFNPLPNQYDVQAAMAHEFGHMLGFTHQYQYTCSNTTGGGPCSVDTAKNTMAWNAVLPGETCARDLSIYDVDNANLVYPNP